MRVLDDTTAPTQHYNVLVYGAPGTGKTSFGVTAPGPVLFALSETQGHYHIKQAAARLGCPMPQVVHMQSIADYLALAKALHGPSETTIDVDGTVLPRPQSLVIDSYSDAVKMLVTGLEKKHPPKTDSDGLPVRKFNFWGVLGDNMKGMVRTFRDAPCHVLFLCELEDKETGRDEEDTRRRVFRPALPMRSSVAELGHAVNVIGVTYRKLTPYRDSNGDRRVDYGIMTVGPQYMVTKPLRPLRDVEEPNFSSWVSRLNGEIVDVRTVTPPDEHLEGVPVDDQVGEDEKENDE